MNIKQYSLLILGVVLLTGCGTSLNLAKYSPATLEKAKHMPSKEKMISNEFYKVIVMDIDNADITIAKQARLGSSMATKINSLLAKGKSVKLVKRINKSNYSKMIASEIKASELSKELDTDVGQADYIITGQLSNSTFDHFFREGYYYKVKTKKGTIRRYAPPSMTYESCAAGNIKIFELPSLNEADSFEFNECARKSTDVRSSRDYNRRNDGLVRDAGDESADTVSYKLKNFFSKKGYIYEMKKDGSDTIVKVTLGSENGAKEGEEVNIYAIEDNYNPLTDVTKQETIKIGIGKISNQLTPSSAWIIVDELNEGKNIHAGDFVKIEYTEGFFSKAGKVLR